LATRSNCLCLLNDGTFLVGSEHGILLIIKKENQYKEVNVGSKEKINSLVQLTNGLIVYSSKNTMGVYDQTFKLIGKYLVEGNIRCFKELRDGRLAAGFDDNKVRIFEPFNDFRLFQLLEGHTFTIYSIVQLRDLRLVTAARDDESLRIWEMEKWKLCL
jgi:WD40 repeat protein